MTPMPTVEINRALIGQVSEPFLVEVEKGAIRKFAEAIGDPDLRFRNESDAKRAGFPGIIAPPTFPVTFRPPVEPEWTRDLDRRLKEALVRRLVHISAHESGQVVGVRKSLMSQSRVQAKFIFVFRNRIGLHSAWSFRNWIGHQSTFGDRESPS